MSIIIIYGPLECAALLIAFFSRIFFNLRFEVRKEVQHIKTFSRVFRLANRKRLLLMEKTENYDFEARLLW